MFLNLLANLAIHSHSNIFKLQNESKLAAFGQPPNSKYITYFQMSIEYFCASNQKYLYLPTFLYIYKYTKLLGRN